MDGILIIDKPDGITSHDVVARVRRILKTKRVGHTGTLDPFATGLMVVLVGKATRLAQFLDKDEKEYEAILSFGYETDTGDKTGTPSSEQVVSRMQDVDWPSVLSGFLGESEQTPPMYSAKKVDGKKLYEHARRGETVGRKAASIHISKLDIVETRGSKLVFRVACSAGTYIRTLGEDIAKAAGLRGHLTELRRTRAGRFDTSSAVTLDQLAEMEDPSSALMPIELAVEHIPKFELPADRIEKTRSGLSTRVVESTYASGEPIRITAPDGELIAVGFYDEDENSVKPKVVLV